MEPSVTLNLTHVSKIRKAFANGSSANLKFLKTQLSKIVQLGRFLPFSLDENPLIKLNDGVISLAESYVK